MFRRFVNKRDLICYYEYYVPGTFTLNPSVLVKPQLFTLQVFFTVNYQYLLDHKYENSLDYLAVQHSTQK